MEVALQKSHKKLATPAKEVSGVSTPINTEACPALGQRDFHVHYAFWHVEQAYFEILAMSYFRTVELWTLIKKTQNLKVSFLSSLLLCLGTNECKRMAEFWHCSQGALSAPVLCILLPPKHSFCLPSLSPECSNCLFARCSCEAAVFLQIYFSNIKQYFLTKQADLKFSQYFFPDLVLFPLFILLALPLCRYNVVWTT